MTSSAEATGAPLLRAVCTNVRDLVRGKRRTLILTVALYAVVLLLGVTAVDRENEGLWLLLSTNGAISLHLLVAALWGIAVWDELGPDRRMFLWSLPLSPARLEGARVMAGAVVLAAVTVVLGGLVVGAWLVAGSGRWLGGMPWAAWAVFFLAPFLAYGLGAFPALLVRSPARWLFMGVIGVIISAAGLESLLGDPTWLTRRLSELMVGPFGILTALGGAADGFQTAFMEISPGSVETASEGGAIALRNLAASGVWLALVTGAVGWAAGWRAKKARLARPHRRIRSESSSTASAPPTAQEVGVPATLSGPAASRAEARALRFPAVFVRQLRLLTAARARELVVMGVAAILATVLFWYLYRSTLADLAGTPAWESFIETGSHAGLLGPFLYAVALVWSLNVWTDQSPSERGLHWAMPVRRGRHDFARHLAGAVWVVPLHLLFVTSLVAGGMLAGMRSGPPPAGFWLQTLVGMLILYMISSPAPLRSAYPWRWIAAVMTVAIAITTVLSIRFGPQHIVVRSWNAVVWERNGLFGPLREPDRWWSGGEVWASWAAPAILWLGIGVAACLAAASVHREA